MTFTFRNLIRCLFSLILTCVLSTAVSAQDSCQASFTYEDLGGGKVQFINTSSCKSGQKLHYYWTFGDGKGHNDENPVHQFLQGGVDFTVSLTITGLSDGTTSSITQKVRNTGLCGYNFDVFQNGYSEGLMVHIYFPVSNIDVYAIDFGDGTVDYIKANNVDFHHVYKEYGTYTISTYMVQSYRNTCYDTVKKQVTVSYPNYCAAEITPSVQNDPLRTVHFKIDHKQGLNSRGCFYKMDYGDGNKDSTYQNPGYFYRYHNYAADGTYKVTIRTTDTFYKCSDTTSVFVTVKRQIYPAGISGNILYLDSATNVNFTVDTATVFLIQYNEQDSSLYAIDTFIAYKDSGKLADFYFTDLEPGKYFIKAALGKNSKFYKDYLPTYYVHVYGTLKWNTADTITLRGFKGEVASNVDVILIEGKNPGGKGFIGGKVIAGANKKEGDPLENIQIMLFDAANQPVTHTYSDKGGNYSFKNLANGKYEIYPEVLGLKTQSEFVTLTDEDSVFNAVIIKVSAEGIITEVLTGLKDVKTDVGNIQVYPNPAHITLHISFDSEKPQTISIEIFGVDGRKLISGRHNLAVGNQVVKLEVGALPTGTYILMLKNTSTGEISRCKFVKLN